MERGRLRALLPQLGDHLHSCGVPRDRVRRVRGVRARALPVPWVGVLRHLGDRDAAHSGLDVPPSDLPDARVLPAIPRELEEAAVVDGCTAFGAFWRIVLPNATPGLLATFVYAFLFAWDELLFVSNLTQHDAETIPLGIRTFISNYQQRYDQLMAAGVVATIPVMLAFFATQRWLVR
ncbi:MAG TPA: carbohydrate ABC transporter permease, partial [Vicinamibacterales bacterium]|nr:carbohydrate ABC transporter permease [Vicinamibacterales bacterium]